MASIACQFNPGCAQPVIGRFARFCEQHRAQRRRKPAKWISTPAIDERIAEIYRKPDCRTHITASQYADKIGWPRWALTKRARQLGFSKKRPADFYWSEREEQILEANAWKSPERIALLLRKAGFRRTAVSVHLKQKRAGLFKRNITDIYTAHSLAGLFGCDSHAITRWINIGLLRAKRRGTNRTEHQGGDMWLIRHADVREFVIRNPLDFDIRKVDQMWFVDLLANNRGLSDAR